MTTTGLPSEGAPGEDLADEDLCGLIRDGEAWPLDLLWRRHGPAAEAWARKRDSAAAEDVVAESFALVFQALLAGGGPSESFRGYLYRTMDSVFAKHWGALRRTTHLEGLEALAVEEAEVSPLVLAEEQEAATAALTELPDRWRQVIVAVDVEGRPVQEVAEELGLSPNSTSALLKRARDGLRKEWMQHLHRPAADLSTACAHAVKHFGILRWGKKGTRRRVETERHLEGCEGCRSRYAQFLEQASAVGLSLAGVIALTREWREKLIPSLATTAAVAASFTATVTLVPPPFEPPPPGTTEVVESPAPSSPSTEDDRSDGSSGYAPPDPDAGTQEEREVGRTLPEEGPTPYPGQGLGDEGAELLYFGDWSGWDENLNSFRRAP